MAHRLRKIGATAGALLLASSLAACSSGGSSSKASPGGDAKVECPLPALAKATGPVKVSLWYGGLTGEAKTAMIDMVKSYNKSQSKVVVTAADQGKDYDTALRKYTAAIPAKRLPNATLLENNKAQFMVDSGTIIPGGACASEGVVPVDDLVPAVKSYYTINKEFQPTAVNVSGLQLYYNKKMFEQAGLDPEKPPATIAELRSDAEKLKTAGIASPISMKVDSWFFEVWLGGVGQDMVNNGNGRTARATKAVFDTPVAQKLMTDLKSMYDDGLIAKISNTPGQLLQYTNMIGGQSAILMETSTAATTIKEFLAGNLSAEDLDAGSAASLDPNVKIIPGFGAMPGIEKPGQVEINGGAFFVTNSGSQAQQAGAMDFMKYMNQVPQQVTWHMQGSYLASNEKVAADPKVQKLWDTDVAGVSLKIATTQLDNVVPSRSGPVIGPYDQYDKIVEDMMEAILLKNAPIDSSLAKAQTDVTKALASYAEANAN